MGMSFGNFVKRSDRWGTFAKFREEATAHPELAVGFSLFWIWIWAMFQNDLFGNEVRIGSVEFASWAVSLFFYALGFFVLGALFKGRRIVPHGRAYLAFITCCMSGGAAFLMAAQVFTGKLFPTALALCGYSAIGVGTACAHVEWGRIMGSRGDRATIIHCSLGTFGAAVLYILFEIVLGSGARFCMVLVPLLFVRCMEVHLRGRSLYRFGIDTELYIPWKFLVTSLIQGLSFGVMWSLFLISGERPVIVTNALSFSAAAIGVLVSALLFKLDFNHLIYQVGFLVMGAGYAVFVLLGDSAFAGGVINSVGCHFVSVLMWSLCAYLISNRRLSANWVFTWTTGSYILGQGIGAVAASAIAFSSFYGFETLDPVCTCMVFLILASALIMLSNSNLEQGWGIVRPGDGASGSSLREATCAMMAREFDLTAREVEILRFLARGRNKQAISEELVLSPNTVKTHIRNIYVKIGVHSQQELIDMVEREQGKLTEEGMNGSSLAF